MKITDKEFNTLRRDILLKIDSKQYDNLCSFNVGYYGLTTYLKEIESFNDSSICDIYYRYLNTKYKIQHISRNQDDCFFMPIQHEALKFIEQHDRCILLAPTSFGKTLIVKEYIYLHQPHTIVYIVPTNALAYELQNSFKNNPSFNYYLMFDKVAAQKPSDEEHGLLFVGTQEKFLEVKDSFSSVDFVVIDEAYKLADSITNDRCYKLSKSFLDIVTTYNCKICLLSPNARLSGFDIYGFYYFDTSFNAVDKSYSVLDEKSFYPLLNDKSRIEKTILFCKTPDDISEVSEYLNCFECSVKDDAFLKQVIEDFHKDWSVAKLLSKGILTHNGVMPKYLQNKMLWLFNSEESKYKLLVGTNSISEGINTPTKNLFIHPSNDDTNESLFIIKNTIGRAGRLGQYPIGHIYSLVNYEEKVNADISLELAVTSASGEEEINDTTNDNKINIFCKKHHISKELYQQLIDKYHYSQRRLSTILKVLEEKEYKNNFYANIVWIAYNVFRNSRSREYSYNNAKEDYFLIRSLLQQFYFKNVNTVDGKKECSNQIYLTTYGKRIEFVKVLYERYNTDIHQTNSEIMDSLIKLNYRTIDYVFYPIARIARDIYETIPDWPFGKNIINILKSFLQRYYRCSFNVENFDDFNDDEKAVFSILKELGLNIQKLGINKEMVDEIINELNVRYSMYDVVQTIKRLSTNSKNKKVYKEILNKYLDYAL